MNIQVNISNKLKAYRKKNDLSQEALAEKLGITSQAVSKWECMQSIPDIETVVEIASMLQVSIDELILGKKPSEKNSEKVLNGESVSIGDVGDEYKSAISFNGEILRYEEGPEGTDVIIKVRVSSSAGAPRK